MRRRFRTAATPSPATRFARWLRAAPLQDAVDRRNAPTVQLLFLIVGLVLPILAALRWHRSWVVGIDVPRELAAVAATCIAWTALYLVRVGAFRHAVGLFIGGSLVLLIVDYTLGGLRAQIGEQAVHLVPLILGGLLLGRRVLWATAGVLVVAVVIGATRDLVQFWPWPALRPAVWFEAVRSLFGLLLVALLLDRTVAALRDTLAVATHRGDELARTRGKLEQEVMARERSQSQLVHAQRMDAVGRLASGVAHDFNNLLGVILGYAGRASHAMDPATADAAIDGIRGAAQRGALVTRRLLSLSRDEPRQADIVDLRTLLADAAPLLRPLLGDTRPLLLQLPDEALHVCLDRHELELGLLNMAANARDAMPDGGTLRLHLERDHDTAVLRIGDTGIGMNDAVRARLFEPFYTTKPRGEGTGLGLAVVQREVTAAGGRIEVESAPGEGTTFTLRLPLHRVPSGDVDADGAERSRHTDIDDARSDATSPDARETDATAPGLRAAATIGTVLLVEDDAELAALLLQALREARWHVVAASRVATAAGLVVGLDRLDAVVSDFELPDGTACDVFSLVAQRFPDARRVLMSGSDRHASFDAVHAPPQLFKPFAPDTLVALLADRQHASAA